MRPAASALLLAAGLTRGCAGPSCTAPQPHPNAIAFSLRLLARLPQAAVLIPDRCRRRHQGMGPGERMLLTSSCRHRSRALLRRHGHHPHSRALTPAGPSAQGMLKMSKGEKATLTCTPDFACTREHIEPSAARRALGPPTRAEITLAVILHGRRPARRAARHPARRDPGVRRRAHWHQRKALLLSQTVKHGGGAASRGAHVSCT